MQECDSGAIDDRAHPARCAACYVPFENHLGVQGTCYELQRARMALREIHGMVSDVRVQQLCDDAMKNSEAHA